MPNYNDCAIEAFLAAEFGRVEASGSTRLLDLGCGRRPYASMYRDRFERSTAGDRDNTTGSPEVLLDAVSLPFVGEAFDFVLFSEVIEHVGDARKSLSEIERVLKPGGTLLITWPLHYMIHNVPHDYTRFTEFGMAQELSRAGFQIEAIARRGSAIAVAVTVLEFFVEGALEALVRMPLIGPLLKPIKSLALWILFGLPYRILFALKGNATIRYEMKLDDRSKQRPGHLSLWTLGYCARARKRD